MSYSIPLAAAYEESNAYTSWSGLAAGGPGPPGVRPLHQASLRHTGVSIAALSIVLLKLGNGFFISLNLPRVSQCGSYSIVGYSRAHEAFIPCDNGNLFLSAVSIGSSRRLSYGHDVVAG